MKKLTLFLLTILSVSVYAVEITRTVVTEGPEKGHEFTVSDIEFPPYYAEPGTDFFPEDGGYSYTWHTDEGHISNAEKPVFFFENSGPHNIHLMLTPRKKGDDHLKVYETFSFNVEFFDTSDKSNGSIIGEEMYLDGQARAEDKIYIVIPLNSCQALKKTHNYMVGFNESQLSFAKLLNQFNLSLEETVPFPDIALGATLNKAVKFTYEWNTYQDDVAAVLEFDVLADVTEPIVLKFHSAGAAQCDNDVEIEFAPIRGPYDPNYKASNITMINVYENPAKKVSPTEVIYTIHFQNIGDAPADSITIIDALPSYLTFLSFEGSSEPNPLVNATHSSGTLQWIIAPSADVKGTNESPSQPEPTTKGWVSFKAEIAKEEDISYSICYCLENVATIYFDDLSPITTDADLIVIGDSLCFAPIQALGGTSYSEIICNNDSSSSSSRKAKPESQPMNEKFIAYPNPTENSFQLRGNIEEIKAVEIFNSLGQKMISLPSYNHPIRLENYPDGLYFVRVITAEEQQVIRLKKQ